MGYASTVVVVLGVEISQAKSAALMKAMKERLALQGLNPRLMGLGKMVEALGYAKGSLSCTWAGEGADSRIHNTDEFNENEQLSYALGLMIASSGYGGTADIPAAVQSCARPDFIKEFKDGIGKMITDLTGEDAEPQALVITQVW